MDIRAWLVHDAIQAMYQEGLMTLALAHIVPAAVIDAPWLYIGGGPAARGSLDRRGCLDALRLETYGFPALATGNLITLTLDHLNGCRWVILLQRPGEEQTLAGLDVRAELLRLGWAGTLTSIVLPFVDLDDAE